MHVEIQVALNFLISFLYNKLPRRRVNQFGDELANALKFKFEGHWYPEKPYKGSAYRCVRCAPPLDPTVFDAAARASGMDLCDIQENLPQELSIWIDPGEVSYRMSEKGPVKILYSERMDSSLARENVDREVIRSLNPEAQCFKPIECLTSQFGGLNLLNSSNTTFNNDNFKNNSVNTFMASKTNPVTFTTAAFAQTKFGSTKLKSNSKRSHRMSPTEFSNYIKQKALQQQNPGILQTQSLTPNSQFSSLSGTSPHTSRSLSPNSTQNESPHSFMGINGMNGTNSDSLSSGIESISPTYPTSNSFRNGFISGIYDNGYLNDIIGSGELPKSISGQNQHSQQTVSINRFASFLDKASPFISAPNNSSANNLVATQASSTGNLLANGNSNFNVGNLLPESTSNGAAIQNNSPPKSFDNYNLNGVTYSNPFQQPIVAN